MCIFHYTLRRQLANITTLSIHHFCEVWSFIYFTIVFVPLYPVSVTDIISSSCFTELKSTRKVCLHTQMPRHHKHSHNLAHWNPFDMKLNTTYLVLWDCSFIICPFICLGNIDLALCSHQLNLAWQGKCCYEMWKMNKEKKERQGLCTVNNEIKTWKKTWSSI